MKLALAVLVALETVAGASPCPVLEFRPIVITPANADVGTGGIVVGWGSPWTQTPPAFDKDTATWTSAGGAAVTRTEIAPGLEVYAGATTLVDGHAKVIATVKRSTTGHPALAAPVIVSITRLAPTAARHPFVNTTATVKGAPEAAIAVIEFDETGKIALSWGGVAPKVTEIQIYGSGGCGQLPANMQDARGGTKVRLAWVDAGGHVGAPSKPVAIRDKTQ